MLNTINPTRRNKPAKGFARAKKEQKCLEAEARQKAADERTPQEQLARLDRCGFRAEKERAKLKKLIGDNQ